MLRLLQADVAASLFNRLKLHARSDVGSRGLLAPRALIEQVCLTSSHAA